MQRQIIGGALAFNIDTPTLEQIVLIVLAIVTVVAVVAWLSACAGLEKNKYNHK